MTNNRRIVLRQHESDSGVAYIELHDHPHVTIPGIVKRTIDVHWLVDEYDGPRISVDFNDQGKPIGIEIVYIGDDDDEDDTNDEEMTP